MLITHRQQGFFLFEVVVASAVIATVLIFLVGSIQSSVDVSKRSLEKTQAAYLLEEGVEAVKAIRDNDFDTITALTAGTPYYLHYAAGAWTLTATAESVDAFTRTVVFSAVSRDASDDIASVGTDDPGTKKGTVTVTWAAPSGAKSESLVFYISNIRED